MDSNFKWEWMETNNFHVEKKCGSDANVALNTYLIKKSM